MGSDASQPFVSADLVDRLARLDVDALERLARLDLSALEHAIAGGSAPSAPATAPSPPAQADPLASLGAAMTAAFETVGRTVEGLIAATARIAPEPAPAPPRRRPRAVQQPPDEPDEPDEPEPSPAVASAADGSQAAQAGVLRRLVGDVPKVG